MSNIQYKVKYFISIAYSSANSRSRFMGILYRNTIITGLGEFSGWVKFSLYNRIAYVRLSTLQKLETRGSISVDYIDEKNTKVADSIKNSNLKLAKYNYSAISINGYNLADSESKSVTLTESNPNQNISFTYKKILGSITINYIDTDGNKLSKPTIYKNLDLSEYNYDGLLFDGYLLEDTSSETVILTDKEPDQNITFVYEKIVGSIVVNYLDRDGNKVYESDIYEDLELTTYEYSPIAIDGYTLVNPKSKTVNLSDEYPNKTISFLYTKIVGSITIDYVDSNKNKIAESTIYSNLELGTHSYSAKIIDGYSIINSNKESVILTANNMNESITFIYEEIQPIVETSITLKYIDAETKDELEAPKIYTGLEFGSHTYDALTIEGYSFKTTPIISTVISKEEPNKTIVFEYIKEKIVLEGNAINEVPYISTYYIKPVVKPNEEVIIDYYITDYYHAEYLEDDFSYNFTVTVRVEGKEDTIIRNLKAGDHSVSLGSFTKECEQKFSILCTDDYGRNSHELFNFFLVQDDVVINEYKMTQADLRKYNIKNDDEYEEKIYVKVDKLEDNTDGTLIEETANRTSIPSKKYICFIGTTEEDENGNAIMQKAAARFWLNTVVKYSNDYNKDEVLKESRATREGLQQFLDEKASEGFNKVLLLPGIYRIDHEKQIYIPTNFTLDMNGATLKLNQFTGAKCLMIDINNTFDSHVVNGTIEGDYFSHDYEGSPNNSEWVNGINIGGESKYSSFQNITIKDIVGYGSANKIADSRDKKLGYTYIYPRTIGDTFELGDIDRETGAEITSTNRTTCNFRDISSTKAGELSYGEVGYLSISVYLGYQGNPCGTWNLIIHYYDENKNYIKSVDAYQYRRVFTPSNAKYCKVTILNEAYPSNLSIQLFRVPTNCSFRNIVHDNCRAVGMAPCDMSNLLFDNCSFYRSGQALAKCAFDAEDGWDMMQDTTFKNFTFENNSYNDFLTCAGHNLIIDNQQSGKVYIWERTRSLVIKNSNISWIALQSGETSNIVRHGVYRITDNNINSGNVASNLAKNINSTGSVGGIIKNSTLGGFISDSKYSNCIIKVNSDFLGYISKIQLNNCTIIPNINFIDRYNISFNNSRLTNCKFEDCSFKGKSRLRNHNGFYSANFINCNFEDTIIEPNVLGNSNDLISFTNCSLSYSENNLIYFRPAAYSIGTFSQIKFDNCIIKNLNNNLGSLLYAYAKPNGYCVFNNCILDISSAIIIFDGYPTNIEKITDYTIKFINTPIPSSIKIISDKYSSNKNINIES